MCDEKLLEQDLETYEWWNPNRAGRQAAKDLSTRYAKSNSNTTLEAWQLVITDDTLAKIVAHTNKRITEFRSNIQDVLDNKVKLSQYLTSLVEMKAWFGILYLRGVLKLNGADINTES